jgi:hypothetical protein
MFDEPAMPIALNRFYKHGSHVSDGPVHVSMNDYLILRWRDVPRVALAGMRLRRQWPATPGAVGLWFASFSTGRRQVSVSIWRDAADLRRFVHSPQHRAIMHDFRDAGILYTTAWTAERPEPDLIWAQARERLTGRVEGVRHH